MKLVPMQWLGVLEFEDGCQILEEILTQRTITFGTITRHGRSGNWTFLSAVARQNFARRLRRSDQRMEGTTRPVGQTDFKNLSTQEFVAISRQGWGYAIGTNMKTI